VREEGKLGQGGVSSFLGKLHGVAHGKGEPKSFWTGGVPGEHRVGEKLSVKKGGKIPEIL